MTDEEMAEEYARLSARQYMHNDASRFCTSREEVKQAYLAGLRVGRSITKATLCYITRHIADLTEGDCGAFHVWEDTKGNKLVDIEWCDGVSAFYLDKVLNLIKEKGDVTKTELVDACFI